ncbi:MAG: ABC transporter ATP-binding protein [Chloroflexi bacterium]|nr:ABC transporter ATP-binding protein [Chloroflexota bacterium]
MMTTKNAKNLIEIKNLKTYFDTLDGTVRAVDGVSLTIAPRETLGLVGESGCGKSVTAYSILRLLPPKYSRIVEGEILYHRINGEKIDLAQVDPRGDEIRSIRGNDIAMIFQEPMTSLSPVHTVGSQIMEAIELHQQVTKAEAKERTIAMLRQVGIAMPEQRFHDFPHQFSGGMRQRAMIAMALSCNPALLIADEPTTALDVTIQAQILETMKALQEQFQMAILIITHNLGVVAEMANRVAVMYMGKIVETGTARAIYHDPRHPYTVGLMQSVPKMGRGIKERLVPIAGSVPDPFSIPQGCAFFPRCAAQKKTACQGPADVPLTEVKPGHWVRCTLYQ